MHHYSEFELKPYVNRYVWIETSEGRRMQGFIQSVDNQFVELILLDDDQLGGEWERNRPTPYLGQQAYHHRPPYHRPPHHRPPYYQPPYNRPPYWSPNRPPYYQQSPFAPFILPLAALTAIGLLF